MKSVSAPISLAGSHLGETRHVCAFFNNDEEEYRVLLPFIKDGLKSGDKAVHVLNPEQHQDHLPRASTRRPRSRAGSSSFGPIPKSTFQMAASIRIGCSRYLSNWPVETPREDFL
jgi:hypothetical protein